MLRDESTPGYEDLFGEPAFSLHDDARSVYSPAAYLVELLALLDKDFVRSPLDGRRPDLKAVVLDAENTFTETPYLDIVNEILERLVGNAPYTALRNRRHPFGLPFSLPAVRLTRYLPQIQLKSSEFYQLFAPAADHDVAAREWLEMSPEDVAVVTTLSETEAVLKSLYGLANAESFEQLRGTEQFAEACGLTGVQMQELIEASPGVTLSADGKSLQWGASVPIDWLDRTHRFVRLARMTGFGFADLRLIIDSCCGGRITLAALRSLAIVTRLQQVHSLTVKEICRLVVSVESDEVRGCSGDILADRNKDYRLRLAAWIDVPESEIAAVVRRYRERYRAAEPSPFDQGDIGLPAIGLLHRCGHLASTLGISVDELFDVLVALDSEPSLRRYTTFAVLGEVDPERRDAFEILAGGDPTESLWLAQTLFAVVTWMQAAGLAGQELTGILGGRPDPGGGRQDFVDGINQAFEPVAHAPALFEGGRFSERAAQVIHDVLTEYGEGVVSAADGRLLDLDLSVAAAAAYSAVTDLGVVVAKDFRGLGLGERLQAKIFGNLVMLGHLDADGTLTIETTDGLTLATDFTAYSETLFKAIGAVVNGTASFFPSDLAGIPDLPEEHRVELYDNLIYNGYLDQDGVIADPGFFIEPDNAGLFRINAGLADATEAVIALLAERITRFSSDALPIDLEIFAELRFTDAQLTALAESLTFNGYLDEHGGYRDKPALAALALTDFGLALEFYPQRRAILDAVQAQIKAFETGLRTFTVEDFAALADDVMSRRVIVDHLDAGLDRAGFTAAEQSIVLRQIQVIRQDQAPYRLDPAALTALGFTVEERDTLLALLVGAGYLTEDLAVAEEWLPYFRNVNSAYDFALTSLEDHSTDIFFLLHAVAVELAAAVNEIVDSLTVRALQQKQALYSAFGDLFGVPADAAAAICEAVTGGPAEAFDALVAPVLGAETWPADARLRLTHRRVRRFALLAAKLGLSPAEITAVFTDQDLVGKFPENLTLPPGVRRFDALLETSYNTDNKVLVFTGDTYWTYAADTCTLTSQKAAQLTELSARFQGLTEIDAAFRLPTGEEWIVGHTQDGTSRAFTRQPGGTRWAPADQTWGKIKNNFTDPARIDGAFVDTDGRTYLFSGDQYIRYSSTNYTYVDEGYPRPVTEWQEREGIDSIPSGPLDAFQAPDGTIHVLTGATGWGRVRNTFEHLEKLDAAHTDGSAVQLYSGGQTVQYSDSIEKGAGHKAAGHRAVLELRQRTGDPDQTGDRREHETGTRSPDRRQMADKSRFAQTGHDQAGRPRRCREDRGSAGPMAGLLAATRLQGGQGTPGVACRQQAGHGRHAGGTGEPAGAERTPVDHQRCAQSARWPPGPRHCRRRPRAS
ncbi:GNAT superfamily N-acetyltransferase [Kibdelosporangium banguiense]|uniref:GNAT superfamily N-acetyltransferase n=1 Tax=Kibdelosporangium banguiense TaxID=1365924 RepID=A0ABS4U2B4_9PSEU|nr:hemopexin repeat-containing protein [Kibdelosporangium banguiense]MBP2330354.1 GNAT superfamily N-acetyltransferase [Kibdelosporangium banguiense]